MRLAGVRYAAIVLAAGLSKRFGAGNKLLHPLGSETLLRRVLRAFEFVEVGRVVVVLGHEAELVRRSLTGVSVETVFNSRYAEGMGSSLACGAMALDEESMDGVLLCVGDLPGLDRAHVKAVLDTFEGARGRSVVVPCFEGVRGHPVCVPASLLRELRTLSGDQGAKGVFPKGKDGVVFLECSDPGCIQDLDER